MTRCYAPPHLNSNGFLNPWQCHIATIVTKHAVTLCCGPVLGGSQIEQKHVFCSKNEQKKAKTCVFCMANPLRCIDAIETHRRRTGHAQIQFALIVHKSQSRPAAPDLNFDAVAALVACPRSISGFDHP